MTLENELKLNQNFHENRIEKPNQVVLRAQC